MNRGYKIGKRSLGVLGANPTLLVFPVVSAILSLGVLGLAAGVFVGGESYLSYLSTHLADLLGVSSEKGTLYLGVIALFIAYFILAAITTFFTSALTFCAASYFTKQSVSFRAGMAAAWRARRKILVWALASATVGIGLRLIEERFEGAGDIAAALFGVAWNAMTFFIVPVLVLDEGVTVRGMFEQSAETLKEKWGESAGSMGIGLIILLAAVVPVLAILGLAFLGVFPSVLVWVMLVAAVIAIAVLVMQTVGAIARTALYIDARTGMAVEEFADLNSREVMA
ncbi:DUF6159 family protein [Halococcus thailandensis]|uniref:Glycerophosphoryl diester phosphodiesterase membrane domain-containing protein n=1 Tax=Halococcus thailandensis JCM 13552 TaxID=1227457 RepID=M0NF27_9EURY|nr:DUF6159 family protein [Halococcus thailandensis]EMA56557.1 hypothetical protein C451_01723 [Halococcus thailandensis JCM 13552]